MTDNKSNDQAAKVAPVVNHEPRVASSKFHYVIAASFALIGIFAGLAASGGSTGAAGFADLCFGVAFALLAWAIVNTYVRKIELRLIDIQKVIEAM